MTKWEYRIQALPDESPVTKSWKDTHWEYLKDEGNDGWELAAIINKDEGFYAYFKRPKK